MSSTDQMDTSAQSLKHYCDELHKQRATNFEDAAFIPEGAVKDIIDRKNVSSILADLPQETIREATEFVCTKAPKIFSILARMKEVQLITKFIAKDQMQNRHSDSLLPLSIETLRKVLDGDDQIATKFEKEQWEFCAPVFAQDTTPRELEPRTILPFLSTSAEPIGKGAYGSVYKIDIHSRHRPVGVEYDNETGVSTRNSDSWFGTETDLVREKGARTK